MNVTGAHEAKFGYTIPAGPAGPLPFGQPIAVKVTDGGSPGAGNDHYEHALATGIGSCSPPDGNLLPRVPHHRRQPGGAQLGSRNLRRSACHHGRRPFGVASVWPSRNLTPGGTMKKSATALVLSGALVATLAGAISRPGRQVVRQLHRASPRPPLRRRHLSQSRDQAGPHRPLPPEGEPSPLPRERQPGRRQGRHSVRGDQLKVRFPPARRARPGTLRDAAGAGRHRSSTVDCAPQARCDVRRSSVGGSWAPRCLSWSQTAIPSPPDRCPRGTAALSRAEPLGRPSHQPVSRCPCHRGEHEEAAEDEERHAERVVQLEGVGLARRAGRTRRRRGTSVSRSGSRRATPTADRRRVRSLRSSSPSLPFSRAMVVPCMAAR